VFSAFREAVVRSAWVTPRQPHEIYIQFWPIPVAARSKAWVCGRLLAEIAVSNIAGGL